MNLFNKVSAIFPVVRNASATFRHMHHDRWNRLCHGDSSSLMWLSTTWCDFSVSPPCHGDDVTFPAWCDLSTVLVEYFPTRACFYAVNRRTFPTRSWFLTEWLLPIECEAENTSAAIPWSDLVYKWHWVPHGFHTIRIYLRSFSLANGDLINYQALWVAISS